MRDRGGHLTQGGQFVGLDDLRVGGLQFLQLLTILIVEVLFNREIVEGDRNKSAFGKFNRELSDDDV